jgi:hypothetical protein
MGAGAGAEGHAFLGWTTTVFSPTMPPTVARIAVVPVSCAMTKPEVETVATEESSEVQVIGGSVIDLPKGSVATTVA